MKKIFFVLVILAFLSVFASVACEIGTSEDSGQAKEELDEEFRCTVINHEAHYEEDPLNATALELNSDDKGKVYAIIKGGPRKYNGQEVNYETFQPFFMLLLRKAMRNNETIKVQVKGKEQDLDKIISVEFQDGKRFEFPDQ